MARYKIITLVDITRTNINRGETNKIKIGQQANFNSLVQAIGMRSNVHWTSDPIKNSGALPHPLEGKAVHWAWEFEAEREEVFLQNDDPVALLKIDLNGVPVVDRLENSADLIPPVFQTLGTRVNTWAWEILISE